MSRHVNQPQWITPSLAVYTTGRAEATIRAWMRNGLLPVVCSLHTRRLLVNATDVARLARTRHHRPNARTRPARALDYVA